MVLWCDAVLVDVDCYLYSHCVVVALLCVDLCAYDMCVCMRMAICVFAFRRCVVWCVWFGVACMVGAPLRMVVGGVLF